MNPWAITFGSLILLILAYIIYRYTGKCLLSHKLRDLRSQGYPVTFEELESRRKLPEGLPNAADFYFEAISCFQEPTEEEKQILPIIGNAERPEEGNAYPAEQIEATRLYLNKNQKCLDLLYQAAKIEKCCFKKDYINLVDSPPLTDIKHISYLLAMDGLVSLEQGNPDQLIQAGAGILRLAKPLAKGPLLIDCLLGCAVQLMGIEGFQEGMERRLFSEEQLDQIETILQDLRKCYDLQEMLIGEQCYTIQSTLHPIENFPNAGFSYKLKSMAESLTGLSEKNVIKIIDVYQNLIEAFNVSYQQQLETKENVLKAECNRLSVFDYKAKQLVSIFMEREFSFGGEVAALSPIKISSFSPLFECHAKIDAAIAACGVERYRLAHDGQLPQTLEELVPEYLEAVAFDPFDGQFLKYEIFDSGYAIYTHRDQKRNESKNDPQKRYSFKGVH